MLSSVLLDANLILFFISCFKKFIQSFIEIFKAFPGTSWVALTCYLRLFWSTTVHKTLSSLYCLVQVIIAQFSQSTIPSSSAVSTLESFFQFNISAFKTKLCLCCPIDRYDNCLCCPIDCYDNCLCCPIDRYDIDQGGQANSYGDHKIIVLIYP